MDKLEQLRGGATIVDRAKVSDDAMIQVPTKPEQEK